MKILLMLLALAFVSCGDAPTKKAASSTNNANNSNNTNNVNNSNNSNNVDPTADNDLDGVLNSDDNCPNTPNSPQADQDLDGVGDRCDNCPMMANAPQTDSDGDGQGDVCESADDYDPDRDRDSDGIRDIDDTCPTIPNPSQTVDGDGDEVPDACDNCPNTPNTNQQDADGDDTGDACESEPSGRECRVELEEALAPQLHIILDASGSMTSDNRFDIQDASFRNAADRIASSFRVSMGYFPDPSNLQCGTGIRSQLDMGEWTGSDIAAALPREPDGGSSSVDAIEDVARSNRFDDPSDPLASQRDRHVLFVADSKANTCTPPTDSQAAADLVADTGAEFHAIAFDGSNDPILSNIASSGGTYDLVSGLSEFESALSNALDAMGGGCTLGLNTIPEDPELLWLLEDGNALEIDGWSYDVATNTVVLEPELCAVVSPDSLSLFAGCPEPCMPTEEVCDYEDNNCDGVVDEGCE